MKIVKLFLEFTDTDNNQLSGTKIVLDHAIPSSFAILIKWFTITGVTTVPKIIYVCLRNDNRDLQEASMSKNNAATTRGMALPVQVNSSGDIHVELQQPDLLGEMNGQELQHVYIRLVDENNIPLSFSRAWFYCGVTSV